MSQLKTDDKSLSQDLKQLRHDLRTRAGGDVISADKTLVKADAAVVKADESQLKQDEKTTGVSGGTHHMRSLKDAFCSFHTERMRAFVIPSFQVSQPTEKIIVEVGRKSFRERR